MRLFNNLKKWSSRVKNATVAGLFLLTYSTSVVSPYILTGRAHAYDPPVGQVSEVTICHGTNSDTNPYQPETPSAVGVGTNSGNGDHGTHTGPIWNSTLKANQIAWGDIIPPFTDTNGRSFPGLNWTAAGQLIYAAGCNIPVASVSVAPVACVEQGGSTTVSLTVTNLVETSQVIVLNASSTQVFTSASLPAAPTTAVSVPSLGAGTYSVKVLNGSSEVVASTSFTIETCAPKPANPGLVAHTPKCSLKNATTGSVSASITNTADGTGAAVTYGWTVTLGATIVATGTSGAIADGASDTVSVPNLAPGAYTLNIVGSDQTTATTYFTIPVCQLTVPACEVIGGPSVVIKDTQFADAQDTRASGRYEFLANGLRIWTLDNSSQAKVAWYHTVNYPLSEVGVPAMDYTVTNGIAPGLQLVVDFDNNGTPDGILVGESVYGNNWWLSNSAAQFVKDGAPNTGVGNGSNWFGALNEWLTAFPSAQVKSVGFSLGSGVLADGILHSITFGCYKWVFEAPVSIGGVKYEVHADGTQVGSTGLSGWTMTLYKDNVSTGQTKVTGADGSYSFTDLIAGNYSVRETLPLSGWTQIYSPLAPGAIKPGEKVNNQNFGNFKNGSINGYKWNDMNGNGEWEEGEYALGGWTIRLYEGDEDEEEAEVATTNADGYYSFTNLAPGTYTVCEEDRAGWVQTYPDEEDCYTVVIDKSGEENDQMNFGNQGRGTITVKKNVDSDGDGKVDYENVSDWTWDLGDTNFATGTTQPVAAGGYTVHEDQKANYHFTSVACNEEKYSQAESVNVYVAPGEDVVCTFTNTRDTGFIKVQKEIYPEDDEGLFNLNIDETVVKEDASDGDSSGWVRVLTNEEYVVSESAGTDTDMSHYDSSYTCWKDYEMSGPNTQFDWLDGEGTEVDVRVGKGVYVVCSFYNERHGELTVVKDAQPNDAQDFEFTLTPINIREEKRVGAGLQREQVNFSALETDQSDQEGFDGTFWLDDDSDETLSNVQDFEMSGGWYTVEETAVEGWDLTGIKCNTENPPYYEMDEDPGMILVWIEPGVHTTCTFTNVKRASVTITKDAQPNFAQPFAFTTNLSGGRGETTFSLTDDGVNASLASKTFGGVVPGTYTVTESAVSGWTLYAVNCTGAEVTRDGGKITMVVVPGADVRCTYVNQKNTIPQVLGTVDPPKLANTGGSIWTAVAMSLTVIGLAILTATSGRRRVQAATAV